MLSLSEKYLQFDRWCFASAVMTFQRLCDRIMLEQFKETIPDHIATYINKQKVKTVAEAAVLADKYVLTQVSLQSPVFREIWASLTEILWFTGIVSFN